MSGIESQGLTAAGLASAIISIIILIIKKLVPIIILKYQDRSKLQIASEAHQLDVDKAEDSLAISAQQFINNAAQDYFETTRRSADKCNERVEELMRLREEDIKTISNLQADLKIREHEFKTITERLETQDTETKRLIGELQLEIQTLKTEVARLSSREKTLEQQLSEKNTTIITLQKQINDVMATLQIRDKTIQDKQSLVESLERQNKSLQDQLWGYRKQLYKDKPLQADNNDVIEEQKDDNSGSE